MKCILDFVGCCMSKRPQREEARSFVLLETPSRRHTPPSFRRFHNRKRRTSAAEWRPSLSAISENNISPERDKRSLNTGSQRMLRRRVASTTTAPTFPERDYSGDYRKGNQTMMIPAFSPAFWF